MTKLLLIQSRSDPAGVERERKNFTRTVGKRATLDFLSALDEKLAWNSPGEFLHGYDGILLGGSADFDLHGGRPDNDPARIMASIILSRVRNIIAYALADGVPIFGICFGHQLIAQMHEGHVVNDHSQGKRGQHEVYLTEEGIHDPVFKHLPASFFAHYAHKDSVTNLPKGAALLSTGASCRFAALRYGSYAYTTQFHPEVVPANCSYDLTAASNIIALWIDRVSAARPELH